MTWEIITGDCREVLRAMPAESVHCCVTSPPYWSHRDYGEGGQLGLEPTPKEYVEVLVGVFSEVRRVLRKDGTLWLNLGDTYAGARGGGQGKNSAFASRRTARADDRKRCETRVVDGLKPKDLVGVPWLVAFALQADGWWLRSEIIWAKPNPMPGSYTDRPTLAHEHVFLLTRARRYYYDAAAVAEPAVSQRPSGNGYARPQQIGRGGREPWTDVGGTRNRRSVWEIATQPSAIDHPAKMPPRLAEPCILAGCPPDGIVLDPFCGAGTVGLVADRLGRGFVGIEINATYAEAARRRIVADAPLLNHPSTAPAAR